MTQGQDGVGCRLQPRDSEKNARVLVLEPITTFDELHHSSIEVAPDVDNAVVRSAPAADTMSEDEFLVQRLAYTYKRAAWAMFVTSLTTGCVACTVPYTSVVRIGQGNLRPCLLFYFFDSERLS